MTTKKSPYHREVIGGSTTNTTQDSQHTQTVEPRWLWSYAQHAALLAVADLLPGGTEYRVIDDPERRAKRIAAHYADLYFKSAEKSRGKLQLYWPGLAAFVVKDIVEAYRYSRDEVLSGGWRNWDVSKLGSQAMTGAMPYELALRVYAALAKGNVWLFMDIYPWLWFVLEYGLNNDGSLNEQRLTSHVGERDAGTLQQGPKDGLEKCLPFNARWNSWVTGWMVADPVWAEASKIASPPPNSFAGGGMGTGVPINPTTVPHGMAHRYVKQNIQSYDSGYHMPPSNYWNKFSEAFYVMEAERAEIKRLTADTAALGRLQNIAKFTVTPEMRKAYEVLIGEFNGAASKRSASQMDELAEIAKQEQLRVLQPLIYQDPKLIEVMDQNHQLSRRWGSWLSPKYAVVYSAQPKSDDPKLQTVFDPSTGVIDQVWTGGKKSLPNPVDRMEYVNQIAEDYNGLMQNNRPYMEAELRKIRAWLNA